MRIYSVIKNDGPGDVLAWKFEGEDFNNNSQLIVSEAEEAIFIKDGVAVQVFGGGKYTLNTSNYPLISRLRNAMSEGTSPFNCKVYFVNKAHKLELLWGTDSPIQMRDPLLNLQTSIQARGSYSIQVAEAKKFLIKLIGNNVHIFTQQELNNYFRSAFLQYIKDAIARYIKESAKEILEVCTERTKIAKELTPVLGEVLDEYGVRLVNFYIRAINIPEDDLNRKKLEEAFANKGVMGILGQDWGRQKAADILGDLANNPGSGGVAAAGAGAGMGFAAGGAFANMAQQMFNPLQQEQQQHPRGGAPASRFIQKNALKEDFLKCPRCQAKVVTGSVFCSGCGFNLGETKKKCQACNTVLPEGANYCHKCGVRLNK